MDDVRGLRGAVAKQTINVVFNKDARSQRIRYKGHVCIATQQRLVHGNVFGKMVRLCEEPTDDPNGFHIRVVSIYEDKIIPVDVIPV
jgi:hypothetical protein